MLLCPWKALGDAQRKLNRKVQSQIYLSSYRYIAEYGFCSTHQRKVPRHHLRFMSKKESRVHVEKSNVQFATLFRQIPQLIKRKDEEIARWNDSAARKNPMTCLDESKCAEKPDSFCHLHNWRQDTGELVKLSNDPPFYACTIFNPCSILIAGKKRCQVKYAKTKFSHLARARCHEHLESRRLCDMVWCIYSKHWVCGPWALCDGELIRSVGTNQLRPELCKDPGQRTHDLCQALGEERAVCATHNVLRSMSHLKKIVPPDERLRDVFVCHREHRCTNLLRNTPLHIETDKVLRRADRPGDWYCIAAGCDRRNASMDIRCNACGTLRSSKCRIVCNPESPNHVYAGCTPGDWGCVACNRLNYAARTKNGIKMMQESCYFCGTTKNEASPIIT